jgi:hypothetical protein
VSFVLTQGLPIASAPAIGAEFVSQIAASAPAIGAEFVSQIAASAPAIGAEFALTSIASAPAIGAESAPPIAVSAAVCAESALAIPDPALSERQIEPAHPPESKKKEMRGAHQSGRVEDKTYESAARYVTLWSDNAKAKKIKLKEKYPDLVMPWEDPKIQYTTSGNALKVLWMELYDLSHGNVITRVSKNDGEGLYGITGFTVQDAKEFNSGEFPCMSHLLHQKSLQVKRSTEHARLGREYKRMQKIWHEAGFNQIADRDGIVTFTYDSELRLKYKKSANSRKSTLQGDGGVGH